MLSSVGLDSDSDNENNSNQGNNKDNSDDSDSSDNVAMNDADEDASRMQNGSNRILDESTSTLAAAYADARQLPGPVTYTRAWRQRNWRWCDRTLFQALQR